jgi:glutamine synthetase type III
VNTTKAQNVRMRGAQMARKAAAVFAFHAARLDAKSYKISKSISVPIAMRASVKTSLSAIADEVVDVRLLVLAPLEVNVKISDMTHTVATC